jgi:ATP-binding cassette subfamily G (WHITE) protein 2 (PDR)
MKLVTIHQPSSEVFQIFDRLLLLSEAGKTLCFGEIGLGSSTLIDCFEKNSATPCKPGQNPAEWIFDITKRTNQVSFPQVHLHKDWYNVWSESQHRENVLYHITELKQGMLHVTNSDPTASQREFAAAFSRQLHLVVERIFKQYWRDLMCLFSKGALCAGVVSFE